MRILTSFFAVLLVALLGGCFDGEVQKTEDASSLPDADPSQCVPASDDDYAEFSTATGRCYHAIEQYSTWISAEAICQARYGGHLASVPDFAHHVALVSVVENAQLTGLHEAWIGLRSDEADVWSWSDPRVQEVWSDGWATGQPNNAPPICVRMLRGSNWSWHDEECSDDGGYPLCESD